MNTFLRSAPGWYQTLLPQVFTQHGAQFGIVIHQQDLHAVSLVGGHFRRLPRTWQPFLRNPYAWRKEP